MLRVTCEHSPNPDNRITLMDEKDKNGVPRTRLSVSWSDTDKESLDRTIKLFAKRLGASGFGRARHRGLKSYHYGSHHMGTTRMSLDPKQGVVDANGRLHELDNLYIAGSSVFPTVGFANPTLTIVALCLRMGDHLEKQLATL